ncbi:IQ calmodulin-binding domain-containing protein [Colletotrichum abscissum]|uniref:IQ calmodulin-binding domain-containing protein n=1 Tax=Colletotrichum abscissum TaxID=1671311 RepID=A0A9Q0AYG8_9PEZI|nr:IQ calmodulin-binding domain-containing protein [Colletotrichum abscissum]KAI3545696.1 IQ calmodulin-binding domain-containing protein [Colletotrichum abscissum]KAK1482395.1 IQ calmodulin-binding domain-containing protein [Colletotrichum abscissum]
MTKPAHELDSIPVPAQQLASGGGAVSPSDASASSAPTSASAPPPPQKTPLLHQKDAPFNGAAAAVITPPASPPVPRPIDEQDESHSIFSPTTTATTTTDTTATTAATTHTADSATAPPSDDTCSLAQSQTSTNYSSRQEYMDSLVPPSQDQFEKIAEVQRTREEELKRNKSKRQTQHLHDHFHNVRRSQDGQGDAAGDIFDEAQIMSQDPPPASAKEGDQGDSEAINRAAALIQRNYRGYRVRREMQGMGLNASTRWVSAIDELQFRELNRPRAKSSVGAAALSPTGDRHSVLSRDEEGGMSRPSTARENWRKAATIARRAGHDDVESDSDSSASSSESDTPEKRAEKKKKREEAVARRKKDSKMMGLQYFLEMVDLKHRYGSNLRVYHEEWKKSDTTENFFYWIDYGGGKNVEMEACPRDRLEREQVRYLSREERQFYLVQVDDEGRLCWAKNGARIDTTEAFKDSIHGIVPADDPTPAWSQNNTPQTSPGAEAADDSRSESSVESALEADRAAKYATPEVDGATGMKKVSHISAATIFNKMLRKSVKKNTWIFVADTSFRLYVGIKASGAFQHSSFLQGSRISSAGLIKIKDGRLSSLSPLSGHYRPPASNFRAFVKNLKEAKVDTSHVSISKSYAVLVGLEVYVKSRQKGKKAIEKMTHKKEKIMEPEEFRKREEEAKDKSESAAKERKVLEKEAEEREENKAAVKLLRKLNLAPQVPAGQRSGEGEEEGREEPVMETLAEERTREDTAAASSAATHPTSSSARA